MGEKIRIRVDGALSFAVQLHKHGDFDEAQRVYNEILGVIPEHPDALHYSGVLCHQQGDSEEAIEKIRRALELVPENPDAWNNLGNIYRESGRLEDAEASYQRVLEVSPEHADTLVNLAVILRGLKQPEEALVEIKKALEINPEHAQAYHNLGNIYFDLREFDESLSAFRKSTELEPDNSNSRFSIARLLLLADRKDEAIDVLKLQVKEYPDDAKAAHMLAAYSGVGVPERATDDFIRQTFDGFSMSFDEVLQRLDYKAPYLINDKVYSYLGGSDRRFRILDIGCGTGLCGPLLKPISELLVGVDLSPGMLKKAKRRDVYDRLDEAELTAFMNAAQGEFDVVVCADTLVYFGALDKALEASAHTLSDGGWLFFTVEQHNSDECADDFWLREHGRYSHAKSYLQRSIETAGFDIRDTDDVVLRKEGGKPVVGTLVAAQRK